MEDRTLELYRIKFSYADFRQLPEQEQLFAVQLAQIGNDLRHVFCLAIVAENGTHFGSSDERKLAVHQLLFAIRLIHSTLHAGWKIIDERWNSDALAKTWYPRLSDDGRNALTYLREYFRKENISRKIQKDFDLHYSADPMWEPLRQLSAEQPAEIITGKGSSNMFYTFAEQVRALALLRAVQKRGSPTQWNEKGSAEHEIQAAAIELCHAYRPVRKQFDAFIKNILVAIVNSLQPKSERFSPPQSTRLALTPPVLFVEEFGPSANPPVIASADTY
jgi:hypothetical protein